MPFGFLLLSLCKNLTDCSICMVMLLCYQFVCLCLCLCVYNAEILDNLIIAKVDEEVFTYVNGETADTVWPG